MKCCTIDAKRLISIEIFFILDAPAQNSNALPNVVVILNVLIAVLIVTLIALFILYRRLLNVSFHFSIFIQLRV